MKKKLLLLLNLIDKSIYNKKTIQIEKSTFT
jgi:hypothetical protein